MSGPQRKICLVRYTSFIIHLSEYLERMVRTDPGGPDGVRVLVRQQGKIEYFGQRCKLSFLETHPFGSFPLCRTHFDELIKAEAKHTLADKWTEDQPNKAVISIEKFISFVAQACAPLLST